MKKKKQKGIEGESAAVQPQNTEQVLANFMRKFEKTYGGRMWLTGFEWWKDVTGEWYLRAIFTWVPLTNTTPLRLEFLKTNPDRNISNYELEIDNLCIEEPLPYKKLIHIARLAPKSERKPFHLVLHACLETLAFNIEDLPDILKKLFLKRKHSEIYHYFISEMAKLVKGEYIEKGWRWRIKLVEVALESEDYGEDEVYVFLKAYTNVVLQKGYAAVWLPLTIIYHLRSASTGKLGVFIPLPPLVEEHEAAFLMIKEPLLNAASSHTNTIFTTDLGELEAEAEEEEAITTSTRIFPVNKENLESAITQILRNVIDRVLEPSEPFDETKQKIVKILGVFLAAGIVLRDWLTFVLRSRVIWKRKNEPEVFFEGDLINLRVTLGFYKEREGGRFFDAFDITFRCRELKTGFTFHFSFEPDATKFSPFQHQYTNVNINDTTQLKGILRDFAEKVRAEVSKVEGA